MSDPLEDAPDVYFLTGYGRAASIADDGELLEIVMHKGAWRVPLVVRPLENGLSDAISPAFSGVYASNSLSSSQMREAWKVTVAHLRDRGVVSVVLRGSPFFPTPSSDLSGLRSISSGRPSIVLDLTDAEAAWNGFEGRCRTAVRKAIKNGLTCEVRPAAAPDLAPEGAFRRLYTTTMQHLDAKALYLFSDEYYLTLLNELGSDLMLAEARLPSGEVVSAALFLRYRNRLHYHLAGSSVAGARLGSNNLMLWATTQVAIERGVRQFHLGAGAELRDGVFMFKRSFGGRERHYDVDGIIIDDEGYQQLARKQADLCKVSVETLSRTNYFPAYRATPTS